MKLKYLIKKELIEIFRQKELLPMIFLAPLIQVVILGYVVTTDVKNISVRIINQSSSRAAAEIISSIRASSLFRVDRVAIQPENYIEALKKGEVKTIIVFRDRSDKKGLPLKYPEIQVLMDGIDSNTSQIAAGYLNGFIRGYILNDISRQGVKLPLETKSTFRFNPELRSINYMGPGIVALLLTIVTMFITSMALVREKEQQTLDTLLVSRLKVIEIFIGKAVPMFLIGMAEMTMGLFAVVMLFGIPIRGNIAYLFLAATIYIAAILSYALLISTLSSTQQQAMFYAWFSMLTFMLLSGFFTPLDNIPAGLRIITEINPLRYLIKIIREIFLKGNGPEYFYKDLLILVLITSVTTALSVLSFRRFIKR